MSEKEDRVTRQENLLLAIDGIVDEYKDDFSSAVAYIDTGGESLPYEGALEDSSLEKEEIYDLVDEEYIVPKNKIEHYKAYLIGGIDSDAKGYNYVDTDAVCEKYKKELNEKFDELLEI